MWSLQFRNIYWSHSTVQSLCCYTIFSSSQSGVSYPLSSHFSYSLFQPLATTLILSSLLNCLFMIFYVKRTCGFFHLASFISMFSRLIYGVACISFQYFLCLSNILFYRHTISSLSIYQLMNIWVIPFLWLLCIGLLWTLVYKLLLYNLFSFMISRSAIACSYHIFMFDFFRSHKIVFYSNYTILQSNQHCIWVRISPYPCQHLLIFSPMWSCSWMWSGISFGCELHLTND